MSLSTSVEGNASAVLCDIPDGFSLNHSDGYILEEEVAVSAGVRPVSMRLSEREGEPTVLRRLSFLSPQL